MKHKGTKNLAILLALALLFALMPGVGLTAYAEKYTTDSTVDFDDLSWGYDELESGVTITFSEPVDVWIDDVFAGVYSGSWTTDQKYFKKFKSQMNANEDHPDDYWVLVLSTVDSVTINPSNAGTINVGETVSFTATVKPEDAPDRKVKWSVEGSNPDAVELYSDAACNNPVGTDATDTMTVYAKGMKSGTAYVMVTSNVYYDAWVRSGVTVTAATVAVTGVTLYEGETELVNGASKTLTVGDDPATLTAVVAPDNATDKTVTWTTSDASVATVSGGVVTPVGAGTATITATATNGTEDTGDDKTATCNVTVSNPAISINPGVRNSTYDNGVYKVTYDGNPYSVTVKVTTPAGATVKYRDTSGTYTLDTSPTITDVGSLTVYYRVTAEGYSEYLGWATVEISKADQTAPAAPTAASVSTNSVTLAAIENGEYSMDGTNWQDSPSFTDLTMNTSYTFYQRVKETANYKASPSSSANISTSSHTHNWSYEASGATVTATCANTDGGHDGSTTATVTINAPAHSVYGDGQSAEATVTGSIDGVTTPGVVYKQGDTVLAAAPTDAGTYTANITLGDATASVAYTVNKANINPSVSISGWTYGQTAGTPSVSGNTGSGTVTYSYAAKGSTDFSAAVPTNAGDYTVKATVAETNNYNGGEATADFTISKATVTVTADAKSKTYGETTDPALTYTCSDLVSGDSFTGALTREAGENAGTYAITQGSLTAGDNYTISFTGASFTINKAAITITADDKSSRYGDELAELSYTVGGAYKAGDELNVTLNTAASPTANVGEYEITVAYNNANYDATLVKGKYTITKTGLTVTAAGYTGSYDGNPHGITVDVGSSGATVYYAATELTAENYATEGSTTAPTYTDAGENTVYFYVVSGNYDPDVVSGSKTVIITRATGTATDAQKPTAKTDLVADNTDQALVTAPASLPEGYTAVQYSLDGETWTDTIPTGKDAGSYTVNYKYVGDKNHNDFQGEPFTVTMRTLTVSFEVNGGSAVAAQSVVKGEKVVRPADPSKSGNAFDGWYLDATFAKTFDFDTPITADITLYAKWTPNDYTLTTITGTTSDANHVWYKDSNVTVVLTAKLATEPDNSFAHYVRTEIDGTPVAATAREGSTVVTLAPAELQRLSVGAHTVSIVFDNGRVDTRLTVRQPSGTPSTGDESHTALWATILAVSALGMAAVAVNAKKRRTAKR